MTFSPRKLATVLAGLAAFAAADAAAAMGSAVNISNNNRINVTTSGNERNDFVVSYLASADTYFIADPAGINANGACSQLGSDTATCPGADVGSVTVNAGASSDTIVFSSGMPATVEGNLDGGRGDDTIIGGPAADAIDGDRGNDRIDGGPGADDIHGGRGTDQVNYATRFTPLTVTIGTTDDNDGNELDQTGLRRDTVHGDVEQLVGGQAGDVLFGDASGETIAGGPGNDRVFGQNGGDAIDGGPGDDLLSGSNGNDTIIGGPDQDQLLGGADDDVLSGGPGNDRLVGKKGFDALNGKQGIDRLFAKDGGRDKKINCGAGSNKREGAKRDKKFDPRPKSC